MKFVKIQSIEATKSKPIYHLTVDKNHNFFGNNLCLHNCGYRGEIQFTFNKLAGIPSKKYEVGDKIGQIMIIPYPLIEFIESDTLSETERGDGGFGSSGK